MYCYTFESLPCNYVAVILKALLLLFVVYQFHYSIMSSYVAIVIYIIVKKGLEILLIVS